MYVFDILIKFLLNYLKLISQTESKKYYKIQLDANIKCYVNKYEINMNFGKSFYIIQAYLIKSNSSEYKNKLE